MARRQLIVEKKLILFRFKLFFLDFKKLFFKFFFQVYETNSKGSYEISDLSPDTTYIVDIQAKSETAFSVVSDPIYALTSEY